MELIINGVKIEDYERVDDLHRAGLQIIQDPKRFCFGVDAVLLTGIVKLKENERLLDLGTGTGIIPILLTAKTDGRSFAGLEIQPESVEMARRSVALNGLEGIVTIDEGDIKNATNLYKRSSFDVITANPPYMNHGGGLLNAYAPRAIARHELLCTLEDVIAAAAKLLKTNGRFYMIHRPHRLTDILVLLRQYAIEPKFLRLIHSHADKEPAMVLIEAVRNGRAMLKVAPPLFIYNPDGSYTDEVKEIYYE